MVKNSPHSEEVLWETDEEFQASVGNVALQLQKDEWDVSRLFVNFFTIACQSNLLLKKNYRMIYPYQMGASEIAALPQVQKTLQQTPKPSNELLNLLAERLSEQT